jgi:hypothetical protein
MEPRGVGLRPVIGRFWTPHKSRAEKVASEAPGRSILECDIAEVPAEVRANIERASLG